MGYVMFPRLGYIAAFLINTYSFQAEGKLNILLLKGSSVVNDMLMNKLAH